MNSQAKRKVKASSARTTRFMPARNAGKERQDAHRRRFVLAIAERIEARRGAAEIDDGEERSRERIEAEVRADPGKAERQCEPLGRCLHLRKHCAERNERHREAGSRKRAASPAAGRRRKATGRRRR